MKQLPIGLPLLCAGAWADDVDTYIQSQLESQHLPSVSIAVIRNGEVVKMKGYGVADLEHQTPATPQTVYLLASVTKQFTATAVMLLAGDGRVKLDDGIHVYLDG